MDSFGVIADPTRRAILDLLAAGERPAGDLVAAFPALTQPAVSRHLRILRDARLVRVRPVAQQRVYGIAPDALRDVEAWVHRYRAFWGPRLDSLERHLAANPTPPPSPRKSR
jgi:DNA-binding transcriptional ArsR family regulator